jgi:hypothetical protein
LARSLAHVSDVWLNSVRYNAMIVPSPLPLMVPGECPPLASCSQRAGSAQDHTGQARLPEVGLVHRDDELQQD